MVLIRGEFKMQKTEIGKPQLIDFFSPDMNKIINQHLDNVKRALLEYDVVIFMARKAVCLFKAFVENGLIEFQEGTTLLSSRALTFEIVEELKGKRIAVIDDVVVFGKSIERVMSYLQENDLSADVFIIACEKNLFNNVGFAKNISVGWQYLTQEEIHQLSEQITEYISASGISYNIDQPIYRVQFDSEEDIQRNLIKKHNILDVSDGLQNKFGIRNFSIHYDPSVIKHCLGVDSADGVLIAKIRFIYKAGDRHVTALPFVLFSFKTEEEIDDLYDELLGDYLQNYIGNGHCKSANKLKILQYRLSSLFMAHFLDQNGLENYQIDYFAERMLFSFNIGMDDLNIGQSSECDLSYKHEIKKVEDRFELDPMIGTIYNFLITHDEKEDTRYVEVGKDFDSNLSMVTYSSMLSCLQSYYDTAETYYVSIITDIFIDKGILIPVILEDKDTGKLTRGFKLGEIFHLTKESMNLFHLMLYQYQELQEGRLLDRTEYEKLCVLFLRKVGYHGNNILSQVKEYGEDCYSICYTRFGPRISDSKNPLDVNKYSTLANRMEIDRILIPGAEGKYIVSQDYSLTKRSLQIKANNFALDYSNLRNAFSKRIVRNNWVRSYDEFITLLAIGNTQRDKLFSLAAELHLFKKTDLGESLDTALYRMFHVDTSTNVQYGIMDGIQSGVWKYICFQQKDLIDSVFSDVRKVNSDARHLLDDYFSDEGDINEAIEKLIEYSGYLLMKIIAFYIAASKLSRKKSFLFRDYILAYSKLREIVSEVEMYIDEQEIYNELRVLQMEAQSIIDKCNIISETGSAEITEYEGKYLATHISNKQDEYDCIVGEGDNSWYLRKLHDENMDDGIVVEFDKSICTLVENGTKRASTNIENALSEMLKIVQLKTENLVSDNDGSGEKSRHNLIILLNTGGISMSTNNNNFYDKVGKVISGDNTKDYSTNQINAQSNINILAAIREIDLSKFPEESKKELSAIQDDCKNGKDKDSILKRLGKVLGKVSFETIKAAVPKIVIAALTSGGYLPTL